MRLSLCHIGASLAPPIASSKRAQTGRQCMATSTTSFVDINDLFLRLPQGTKILVVQSEHDLESSRSDVGLQLVFYQIQISVTTCGTVRL